MLFNKAGGPKAASFSDYIEGSINIASISSVQPLATVVKGYDGCAGLASPTD